jgi:uncharacterized protein YfiM (DUF2279 family)
MNSILLATALLLQTPVGDTASVAAPDQPVEHASVRSLHVGEDKVQHFLMSYAIASFTYSAARAAGLDRDPALGGAMAGSLIAGAAKELVDRRTGGDPSFGDFFADLLGVAAAYIMLRQVR